jgi:sugar transferase EpsL
VQYRIVKRGLDISLSLLALLLLLPVFFIVALLVWWRLGTPVIFRQRRPGRDGRLFTMYKFRSMVESVDPAGTPLTDAERLDRFGQWLRATSLDELPELWNVLRGDMSLVGPRPLLCEYLRLYSDRQARRHEVRPGITGWAQINGRNETPWPARLEMDVWYVENYGLRLDLEILRRTLSKVIAREGISQKGHVSMERFRGN